MAYPTFAYSRLPDSKTHIRLLKICRQKDEQQHIADDEIHCTVIAVPLSEATLGYTAVSYTWGDQDFRPSILLQNEGLQVVSVKHVTKTVVEILHRIRESEAGSNEPESLFWIDQICIQQTDDIEKSNQVSLMTDIYGQAKEVFIWLGPSSDGSGDAVRYLKDMCRDLSTIYGFDAGIHTAANISQLVNQRLEERPGDASGQRQEFIQRVWKRVVETPTQSIIRLLSRPWFTRVWTIQEACLCRNTIFHCGDDVIPADTLRDALLSFIGLWGATGLLLVQGDERIGITDEQLSGLQMIDISRLSLLFRLRQRVERHRRKEVDAMDVLSILELVKRFNTSDTADTLRLDASDPRDRIYGLHGLARKDEWLKVDYMRSVEQVYTDFAAQALRNGDVDILVCTQRSILPPFSDQSSPSPKLPSWVPDWASGTHIVSPYGLSATFQPYFSASGTLKSTEVEFKKPNTLIISGVLIDQITTSSVTPYNVVDRATFDAHYTARHLGEILAFCSAKGSTYQDPIAAAWRIAIGGLVSWREVSSRRAILAGDEQFSNVFRNIMMLAAGDSVPHFQSQKELAGQFLSSMQTMSGRKSFRTQNGYVGLGPARLVDGDVVVVLYGGSVPYILRRDNEVFQFIGEAYCEGLMDGEGLQLGIEQKFCIL
jgi:hypothetical protein